MNSVTKFLIIQLLLVNQQIGLAYKLSWWPGGFHEQGCLGWSEIPSLNYCLRPILCIG